jgi:hypothetical protein
MRILVAAFVTSLCLCMLKGEIRYNISYENSSAYTSSLLKRPTTEAWDETYAYRPVPNDPTTFRECGSLQIMSWGSAVRATSFCYNGLISFEVCKR